MTQKKAATYFSETLYQYHYVMMLKYMSVMIYIHRIYQYISNYIILFYVVGILIHNIYWTQFQRF